MRLQRGLLMLSLIALAAGGILGAVYTLHDGILLAVFMLVSGAPAIAAAHLLAGRRAPVGTLRRRFAVGIGATVAILTSGVFAIAELMFISTHDAVLLTLLLLFAGALTIYASVVLGERVTRDIRDIRDGVRAVGEGRRDIELTGAGADEVGELAAAANLMVAKLAEREGERDAADQARRGLVAAISHDLRTPLTSLRLLANAVEDDLVDQDTRYRYMQQISLQISALSGLIDDLFELSRLEAGDIEWSLHQVELADLLDETIEAMGVLAAERGIVVRSEVAGPLPLARANPEKLQRVLFNLIQNAIHHTPADGSITVAAQPGDGTIEIEVCDSGTGLSPLERDRGFDAFFRGDDGSRSGSRAGLGLTICRAIVEAHGGRIWFADSSRGARVRFTIPQSDHTRLPGQNVTVS